MALPGFPQELINVLNSMALGGIVPGWNITRTEQKIRLQLEYFCAPVRLTDDRNKGFFKAVPPPLLASIPSTNSTNVKKRKKKSPSRLARDRRRLLQFKQKKNCDKIHSIPPTTQSDQPSGLPGVLEKDRTQPASNPSRIPVGETKLCSNPVNVTNSDCHRKYAVQNERFLITKFDSVMLEKITLKFSPGGAILGSDIGPDGKPRILDSTPLIKQSVSIFDNILKLKESMAGLLNSLDTIPVTCLDHTNIVIHCLAPEPLGRYSWISAPDCLPISSVLLDKEIPKYNLIYDISLFPTL